MSVCAVITANPDRTAAGLPPAYQAALAFGRRPSLWQRLRYGKRAHGAAWCVTHRAVLCRTYSGALVHHGPTP